MKQAPDLNFDHNSGSPIPAEVADVLRQLLTRPLANPSSTHAEGRRSRRLLEQARASVARLLGSDPREITFTSGGTEANQTALYRALGPASPPQHFIVHDSDHASILEVARWLAEGGHEFDILPTQASGQIDAAAVLDALRPNTAAVAILSANNETGVCQPVAELGPELARRSVWLHVDAVQSAGKQPLDVGAWKASSVAISGHKIGAPAGIGALYCRRGAPSRPLQRGGRQERGHRGGTENLLGAIALGLAADCAGRRVVGGNHLASSRDRFEQQLRAQLEGVAINGAEAPRLPNTSNVSFAGIDSRQLLDRLSHRGLLASAGSACHAGAPEPSHVLRAMGLSAARVRGAVRFSFSGEQTCDQILCGAQLVAEEVQALRKRAVPTA